MVSSKETVIFVLLYVMSSFSLAAFKFLIFKQFDYGVLGVVFFMFFLLGLLTCGFMVFIKFRKILVIISSIIFCLFPPFPLGLHLYVRPHYIIWQSGVFFKSFFLFVCQIGQFPLSSHQVH